MYLKCGGEFFLGPIEGRAERGKLCLSGRLGTKGEVPRAVYERLNELVRYSPPCGDARGMRSISIRSQLHRPPLQCIRRLFG